MSAVDFLKLVALQGATFKTISFRGAQFGEGAYFDGAEFLELADFVDARFGERASFISARFGEYTWFNGAHFDDHVFFSDAKFGGVSIFDDAVFGEAASRVGTVSFESAVFEGPTSFERTTFTSHLPLLRGAVLHETTTVTANDKYWPPLKRRPKTWSWGWPKKIPDSTGQPSQNLLIAKESAAKLRHAMARQMLPEEEHFFYRREMHITARIERWSFNPLLHGYKVFSNFGHSLWRPFILLYSLWIVCGNTYLQYGDFPDLPCGSGDEGVLAFGFSFANTFSFFGFQRAYFGFDCLRALPDWMQAMAAAQTVLSFILLFFLGLGLRTRFRLR